jgi:hypothetical protein
MATTTYATAGASTSAGGGGAGHAAAGGAGQTLAAILVPVDVHAGGGGTSYPTGATANAMFTPSAGSGGGAGGGVQHPTWQYSSSGGGGGAGGGFIDFTSSGDIRIYGTLDAAGSPGANGMSGYAYYGAGGGGGGSGGGIRLLTPQNIDVTGGTVTAAGGAGGFGVGGSIYAAQFINRGGAGSVGRLVMEDGDSSVLGFGSATVIPGEGSPGFHRDVFDATRFQGGGLEPDLLTGLIFMGPPSIQYANPTVADFPATVNGPDVGQGPGVAIPGEASRGVGATGIMIEARGYPLLDNGLPDETAPTPFYTVGYFTDSGQADSPDWVAAAFPPDVGPRSSFVGNVGDGFANLNGRSFVQFRITFFLRLGMGPFDPGPFINRWLVKYSYDQ